MSIADLVASLAGAVLVAWGSAHLAPTRTVADGFGAISRDSRRILVMEWVAEGIAHISIGVLAILITVAEGAEDPASQLVYRVAAGALVALAALTTMTGARTPVIWFRVCPLVLGTAAALLVAASLLS